MVAAQATGKDMEQFLEPFKKIAGESTETTHDAAAFLGRFGGGL